MDVTAGLPDCAGQPANAVSAYTSKNGGSSKVAQKSAVRMSRCMDTSSTTQKAEIQDEH